MEFTLNVKIWQNAADIDAGLTSRHDYYLPQGVACGKWKTQFTSHFINTNFFPTLSYPLLTTQVYTPLLSSGN